MTPALIRSTRPSLKNSVCTPRCLLVEQVGQNRVRKTSITDLDRVAVLDEPGHVVADALRRFI